METEYIEKIILHKGTGEGKGEDKKQEVGVHFNFIENIEMNRSFERDWEILQ